MANNDSGYIFRVCGIVALATSVFATSGCGDYDQANCGVPGTLQECPCHSEGRGLQTCEPSGAWGRCDCRDNKSDADVPPIGDVGDTAVLAVDTSPTTDTDAQAQDTATELDSSAPSPNCYPGEDCMDDGPAPADGVGGMSELCLASPTGTYPPALSQGYHLGGYDVLGASIYAPASGTILSGYGRWGSYDDYQGSMCYGSANCPCDVDSVTRTDPFGSCTTANTSYSAGAFSYDAGTACYSALCGGDLANGGPTPSLPCNNQVTLEFTADGKVYRFKALHIKSLAIAPGDFVVGGQKIAEVGNIGWTCTAHQNGTGAHGHVALYEWHAELSSPWVAQSGWFAAIADDCSSIGSGCSPDATRCEGGQLYTCDSAGVSESHDACPSGTCQDEATCAPQGCAPSATRCEGGVQYICNGSGTAEFSNSCPSMVCQDATNCTPQFCLPNATRCSGGTLFTCNGAGTNETASVCMSGACQTATSCLHQSCTPSATRCVSGSLYTCNGSGSVETASTCASGSCQNATACLPQSCTPSTTRCSGGTLFTCNGSGTAETNASCPSAACQSSTTCLPQSCTPQTTRCSSGTLFMCNSNGTGESSSSCPSGSCQSATNCLPQSCTPHARRCSGGSLFTCNGSGTGEASTSCPSGSCQSATSCLAQSCTPNTTRCVAGSLFTCNGSGTGEIGSSCPSGTCQNSTDCTTCVPQDHLGCSNGDLYWYDSCGSKGSFATSCNGLGCVSGTCSQPAETCNGLDDDGDNIIDEVESCWRPVYRFWDTTMPLSARSRCYGTSSNAPSGCAGYSLEFAGPVFYLYAVAVTGTVGLIPFDATDSDDHILAEESNGPDLAYLRSHNFSERARLGYMWSSTTQAPVGNFYRPVLASSGTKRDLRRYSLAPPGIHLYANNPAETAPGWAFEGVRGYVWSSRW